MEAVLQAASIEPGYTNGQASRLAILVAVTEGFEP